MRKVAIPFAFLALIGLDQWVKHWVVANIALNQVIKAIPGLFSLTYLQNRGAAFSILQDQKYFFVILTVLVIGAALVYPPEPDGGGACVWILNLSLCSSVNALYQFCP